MLPFGHMGIGSKLVSPWSKGLPKGVLLLGTLMPDLIDKPLYYGLSWATGKHGAALGLISSTRTFGHTALVLISITLVAVFRQSRILAALALGMATHLFLDNLWDGLSPYFESNLALNENSERAALVALLYPFYLPRFSIASFHDIHEHTQRSLNPMNLGTEIVGMAILSWDWWKNRHESEIIQLLYIRRHLRKERRHHPKRR